ncbi:MAG: YihA family ribosome biogenesis GTP-binding protein [Balneola sp.]|nr:YihA family ribosome biogenesis GTP-binding protein [Balneola sp.]MBO6651719.1 YihA family ribosome biogenesis GTP-binding protein [Balneola sp.]MBO6712843.1 YihA family ribosome biogenesis GTP-binding protein [Balneola sp.]MBO6801142.1 YihA family ribosome biogenesis GTP-binding protein [Balneola sp.]MBO6871334.1 YihA family ribosome biogenesis GTP-binding protein [Balneola sp.]
MNLFNGKAKFITSATKIEECPPDEFPEVCFAGRSNVGKSSLINAIVNRKNIARTSNVPGKTQQMNYYQIGDDCFFVDLPGYGFAKVPKKERERWGRNIRQYLSERESLRLILSVIDARHEPSALDQDFFYWLASNEMPFCVLMSKADKLSNNKFAQSKKAVKNILSEMNIEVPVLGYSASSRKGIPEIQELIQDFIKE